MTADVAQGALVPVTTLGTVIAVTAVVPRAV
jgi:hypothetical protein